MRSAVVLAGGLLLWSWRLMERGPWGRSPQVPTGQVAEATRRPAAPATGQQRRPAVAPSEADTVEINIAYGTEKQQWFEAAAAEFQKTEAGRGITVELHGMGSMEGARAVLDGPEPIPIQVWSPASSAYRDAFERRVAGEARQRRRSSRPRTWC